MSKFDELPKGLVFIPGRGWFIDLDRQDQSEPRARQEPKKEPHPLVHNVRPKRWKRGDAEA